MIVPCSCIYSYSFSSFVYDVLKYEKTALHYACRSSAPECRGGHSEVVKLLLEKGCDPTLKDKVSLYSSESL